jgi:arginase family enzyme
MHDVRDRGIREVVADTLRTVGDGPMFVSIDVDVLDPAFAPGTGTPEPGVAVGRVREPAVAVA